MKESSRVLFFYVAFLMRGQRKKNQNFTYCKKTSSYSEAKSVKPIVTYTWQILDYKWQSLLRAIESR